MKGKNVIDKIKARSPEERNKFELVKNIVELCLSAMLDSEEQAKYDPADRTFKIHKKELDTDDIVALFTLTKSALDSQITIKRSGTGVTIIVKLLGPNTKVKPIEEETRSTRGVVE